MKGSVLVGTSGFSYSHWADGVFYPHELHQDHWLEFYALTFKTVEINLSFYRLPSYITFENWRKRTPKDFVFSLKGSRYITHVKKLKDCEGALNKFFEHAEGLEKKLGVVLWQLPQNFHVNAERLGSFVEALKQVKLTGVKTVRHSFEFRHESWFTDDVFEILKAGHASLCIADSSRWPVHEAVTADHVYLRFHGRETYRSDYPEDVLKKWGAKAGEWTAQGIDVYAYFNNDAHAFAIKNAMALEAYASDKNT